MKTIDTVLLDQLSLQLLGESDYPNGVEGTFIDAYPASHAQFFGYDWLILGTHDYGLVAGADARTELDALCIASLWLTTIF